jgi:uncharacterized protein YegL
LGEKAIDFERQPFGNAEFLDNPQTQRPCILWLDVSASMLGAPIEQLNDAIVTFGPVKKEMDFTSAVNFFSAPPVHAGQYPMGEAIEVALRILRQRKSATPCQWREFLSPGRIKPL